MGLMCHGMGLMRRESNGCHPAQAMGPGKPETNAVVSAARHVTILLSPVARNGLAQSPAPALWRFTDLSARVLLGEPNIKLLISLPGSKTNPAKFFAISFVSDLGLGYVKH